MHECSLSIVIPAYNEADGLREVVERTIRAASASVEEWEILIVDDGSEDDTARAADEVATAHPEVRVLRHESNRGSGAAIWTGIQQARCELVMYVPADGQFPVREIGDYVRAAEQADIVLGVRNGRSGYTLMRRLNSELFVGFANFLFHHRFRDVNWVNLWRRRIFDHMRPVRSRGVFLMEEILSRAIARGCRVVEIPSASLPRRAGEPKGGRPGTMLKVLREMFAVWLELEVCRRQA